ncbi:SDR family oxidoreductase [Membranihabitans marinus]|uniref:SDR family oxidoreductase n=1 Tax=Membranihabitans marinus TaxID=1227546 RepID=UPI001F2AE0FC|nr:SDR family oxidoreductase [Membranihabitans marinus]
MLPNNTFAGKTILITGGGSGLGKSMGKYFASLGGQLIITGRGLDKLTTTAEEIKSEFGSEVLPIAGDVRKIDDVENVVQKGIEKFGQIDILINNAAGNFISPTERLSHRAFESVIGIVLQGTANYTLTIGKYWIENKIKGVVLNIVVSYAWTGSGYTVPSAAAKAGVLAMTKSLAVEWGHKYGIRHVAIAPGPFPTKGAWDRLFPPSVQKVLDPAVNNPLHRVGEHIELAQLAAYLTSDYAAYINGECITIDGGEWLMGAGMFNKLSAVPEEMWDQLKREIKSKTK